MRHARGTLLLLAVLIIIPISTHADNFSLVEKFNISHPDQVVDFDLAQPISSPDSYQMIGPGAQEVPYQVSSDGSKIYVRVNGGLGKGGTKTWTLQSGARTQKTSSLVVDDTSNSSYIQITNGLTGVRIPKVPSSFVLTPAPIQGILYRDGTWSATGPNILYANSKTAIFSETGFEHAHTTAMKVEFIERGPVFVSVKITYSIDGSDAAGTYVCTISLQDGQPSVMIEEDATDLDVYYQLQVDQGLDPTSGRYRGHHATTLENGRHPDGSLYGGFDGRPLTDALVDFQFKKEKIWNYLAKWDPWIYDSGWYWQLFNGNNSNDNLLGIFGGRASRVIGASNAGTSIFNRPLGVSDLTSRVDPQNNIHVVYQTGDTLNYMKLDSQLNGSASELIGQNLEKPEVRLDSQGNIYVTSFDSSSGKWMLSEKIGGASFQTSAIQIQNASSFIPESLYGALETSCFTYQAISGTTQFLLLYGNYQGKDGAHLFSRTLGDSSFVFRQTITIALANREIWRPCFETLPDGRVLWLFCGAQYLEYGVINVGSTDFGPTIDTARPLFNRYLNNPQIHAALDFGSALDPKTGNFFASDGNQQGYPILYKMENSLIANSAVKTALPLQLNHHGEGPNRRTMSTASDGTILVDHSGVYVRFKNNAWEYVTDDATLGIDHSQIQYLPNQNKFILIARKDGVLTLFNWNPSDNAPTVLKSFPATEKRSTGISVSIYRHSADNHYFTQNRYQWGIFTGAKSQDLKDPYLIQPIGLQTNLHGGFNLNKIYRYVLNFADPDHGYGGLFAPPDVLQNIITQLRTNPNGLSNNNTYYAYLYNADPTVRDLIDMWTDKTGVKNHYVSSECFTNAGNMLDHYVNFDGVYDFLYHYWHGGLVTAHYGIYIDSVLADPITTQSDKDKVKNTASAFANILWDNDFVPLFSGHGMNLGTANMPVQQTGYRQFYALFLQKHPLFSAMFDDIYNSTLAIFKSITNVVGAEMGSPHYLTASVIPTINTLLQIQQIGKVHPFGDEDRLRLFGDFYMNLLTPPEVRFGQNRKMVCFGDGSTESTELLGELATGYRDMNAGLSQKYMWGWNHSGKIHSGFFGSSLVKIDENIPESEPTLKDAHFDGYMSVLRNGWQTPNESAFWLLNGDFYSDHRNDDRGSFSLYALGAPISVSWSSIYYPQAAGGSMKSLVIPESLFPEWNTNNIPLTTNSGWNQSSNNFYASFRLASKSNAIMQNGTTLTWTRTVHSLHPNETHPIFYIRDEFAGSAAAQPKILTYNLMASGDVQTSAGKITPVSTLYDAYGTIHQNPAAGTVFDLQAGLNKMAFTGQQWKAHPSNGVDWELYTVSDTPLQANIGNWSHTWNPVPEMNEYQGVNGSTFKESQDMLRIRGTGSFGTLILPYNKNNRPQDLLVKQLKEKIIITSQGELTVVSPTFYSYSNETEKVLTAFGADAVSDLLISAVGGPVEIVQEANKMTITAHGPAGLRQMQFPGFWKASQGITFSDGVCLMNYVGPDPVTVVLQAGTPADPGESTNPVTVPPTNPNEGNAPNEFSSILLMNKNVLTQTSNEKIVFTMNPPHSTHAQIKLYDRSGSLVSTIFDGDVSGMSTATWDGKNDSQAKVTSGVYIAVIQIDNKTTKKKIVVVR